MEAAACLAALAVILLAASGNGFYADAGWEGMLLEQEGRDLLAVWAAENPGAYEMEKDAALVFGRGNFEIYEGENQPAGTGRIVLEAKMYSNGKVREIHLAIRHG